MPPPDTDDQALVAIAVHLARLDERGESRSEQLDKIESGVDKINGRLRLVEQNQAATNERVVALDDRVGRLTKIGGAITGGLTMLGTWLKLDS